MTEEYPAELELLVARFAPSWPPVIDVSPGWQPPLIALDKDLAQIAPGYVVQQVKSKFGALTFHASPSADPYEYVDQFRETIEVAEWRSIETCEECGAPAAQYVLGLWVWTLCPRHARDRSSGSAR